MKLIIDVPEHIYKYVQATGNINMIDTQQIANAIFDGVLLPKGHGRLKDVDKLCGHCGIHGMSECWGDCDKCGDYVVDVVDINKAPTIIEAYGSEKEDEADYKRNDN